MSSKTRKAAARKPVLRNQAYRLKDGRYLDSLTVVRKVAHVEHTETMDSLLLAQDLIDVLIRRQTEIAAALRAEGVTWQEIADQTGCASRQTARYRYTA